MIYMELGEGVQDPEGVWGWLPKKRDDLNSSGRYLTNREMYDYFTKCKIVLEYKLVNAIRNRCLAVDFAKDLEELERESPQKRNLQPN